MAEQFQIPSDAQVFVVAGSSVWATFDVGGVRIAYQVPTGSQATYNTAAAQHITQDQWTAIDAVQGGDAEELRSLQGQWSTYREFFDSIVNQVMSTANPARNDSGVLRVLAEFAGRPDMTTAELQNKLKDTQWYQGHTQAQLQWNDLPEAERTKQRENIAAQMAQTWFQFGGVQIPTGDPRITNYIEDVASGKMGFGAWTEQVVKSQALQDATSPWSRTIADENKAKLQPGVDVENTAQRVKDLARRWGVQWSEPAYQDWGRKITTNEASEADVLQALKDQAAVLYPWKNPEIETASAAAPWVQTFSRVLETETDLFDPRIQQALSAGTPVWEFEQSLKKSTDWLQTKNAREEMTSIVSEAGKRMGFN